MCGTSCKYYHYVKLLPRSRIIHCMVFPTDVHCAYMQANMIISKICKIEFQRLLISSPEVMQCILKIAYQTIFVETNFIFEFKLANAGLLDQTIVKQLHSHNVPPLYNQPSHTWRTPDRKYMGTRSDGIGYRIGSPPPLQD